MTNKKNLPFLISPLHDPQATYLKVIKEKGPLLKKHFSLVIIGATDATHPKVLTALKNLKFTIRQGNYSYGEGYRQALAFASQKGSKIFLCADFDRILHWAFTFPQELKNTLSKTHTADYTIIGRTQRAFSTHPLSWQLTEKINNTLLSKALGLKVDIGAGSTLLNQKAAKVILAKSKEPSFSVLAEWPLLIRKAELKVDYLAVEGYEWEDSDRFQTEIKKIGFQKWLDNYDNAYEWRKRIDITNQTARFILNFNKK